ncbi:MAG: HepT-like ribonuclease domain-containing protein [Tardiphaga sp.]
MPSRSSQAALLDIEHHLALISNFVAGMDRNQFTSDLRTNYAVIRCLEIISEASRRLLKISRRGPHIAW